MKLRNLIGLPCIFYSQEFLQNLLAKVDKFKITRYHLMVIECNMIYAVFHKVDIIG